MMHQSESDLFFYLRAFQLNAHDFDGLSLRVYCLFFNVDGGSDLSSHFDDDTIIVCYLKVIGFVEVQVSHRKCIL